MKKQIQYVNVQSASHIILLMAYMVNDQSSLEMVCD